MFTLLLGAALAADPETLRRALEEPGGWEEVHRKRFDDLGIEVVVSLKRVGEQPCLEATTLTSLSPDLLLQLAADIPHQGGWSTWEIPVSERLGGQGSSFDYYQLLDNPNPVADRYWFVRGTPARSGEVRGFYWVQIDPAKTYPKEHAEVQQRFPGAVMTQVNVGNWAFAPEAGQTRVTYRICTDAGGNIPDWAKEYAAKKTLPTNVADIVREGLRRVSH